VPIAAAVAEKSRNALYYLEISCVKKPQKYIGCNNCRHIRS